MEASIWRFNRRSGDVPMTSVQPVSAWSGMTPSHLDARALLASLLLHAAIGTVLVIISTGIVLPPAAEPPPLTVTLLAPEQPPAPAVPVQPSPVKPSPANTSPVHPHEAPPELHPMEPATPAPPAMPQPERREPEAQPAAPQAPMPPSPPAPAAPSSSPLPEAVQGARAIYQPTPVIPDDLREEALNASAVARFHIGADGTATVELVTATRNPRLNRVLLETLSRWRFFPALKDGRPVASTQDLPISVEVK